MSTIITRNSATSGSTPSSLVQGELAINVTDGRLFYGSGSGNVVKEFGISSSYASTASYAEYAVSASYEINYETSSSYADFAVSASHAINANDAISSSYALTASYVENAQTASYVTLAQTASYVQTAQTASYVLQAVSASYVTTASYSNTSTSASHAVNADNTISSSYALTSSYVENAQTASYVLQAVSASYSITASYSNTSTSASHALNADNAISSSYALTASYVNPLNQNVLINGNLNVTSSFTASGLIYPTTDGIDGQVLKTDGLGNLFFENTTTTTISIKNVSGGTIAKGTPCYITGSGTSGNVAGVYPADASDSLKMPAGVIAGETLNDGDEGIGLLNGFINGVNTSAFNAGDSVYVAAGGGYTNVRPTGSTIFVQKLGNIEKVDASNGSGVINGPAYYNDLPNVQQGYTWVGNADGVATAIATSSIQNVVSSSFASTASYVNTLNQIVRVGNDIELDNQIGNIVANSFDAGLGNIFIDGTAILIDLNASSIVIDGTSGEVTATTFIGNLTGTASYATQALSSSFSTTASYYGGSVTSASYALTASYSNTSTSASYALNATTAQTASYVLQAVSASFATLAQTANTASYVVTAQTASYVLQAVSASYALNATNATTASYVLNAVSASFASTVGSISSNITNNTDNRVLTATGGGSINGEANLTFDGSKLIVTSSVEATSFTGSFNIPDSGTLGIGQQTFYPQGNDGFSVNEDFNVGNANQTAYHFTSGDVSRTSVVFSLARTTQFTNMFGVTGSSSDNKFVFGAEFGNTDFEWRKSLGVTPVQLQGGTLLASLSRDGNFYALGGFTGSLQGTSSFATSAATASYVLQAVSASFATTAQTATTASYVQNAQTASYVLNAVSASFTSTASYVNTLNQIVRVGNDIELDNQIGAVVANSFDAGSGNVFIDGVASLIDLNVSTIVIDGVTGDVTATNFIGDLTGTASYATQAISSSYADTAFSALNTPFAVITASNVGNDDTIEFLKGGGGTFQVTVNNVQDAVSASYAPNTGVTKIIAGSNINISPTSGIGDVTINATAASPFPYTGSAIVSGSLIVTGSLLITGSATLINQGPTILSGSFNVQGDGDGFTGPFTAITIDDANFTRTLHDSQTGASSLDFGNRSLVDGSGNFVLSWDGLVGFINSTLYSNNTIDATTRNTLLSNFANAGQTLDGVTFDTGTVADFDLVYLETDGTWYPVDQSTSSSTKLLGICLGYDPGTGLGAVILEGDISVSTSPGGAPVVNNANYGLPIYIDEGAGNVMDTTIPTTGYVRILGHCYYNDGANNWIMKFKPSNEWYII